MTSRLLLNNRNKIKILIDSKTFEGSLKSLDRNAIAILSYKDSELFNFIRSPYNKICEELSKIKPYELIEENFYNYIKINNIGRKRFGYNMHDINDIAKKFIKKMI